MQFNSDNSQPLRRDGDNTRTSSFRVYYGGSGGAIPFKWESAPGTPIHAFSFAADAEDELPPLTPPPSFHFPDATTAWPKSSKTKFRPNLLIYVLQKLKRSARHVSPLHSFSSFSTSTSSSSFGSLTSGKRGYFRVGRLCGPLHAGGDYFDKDYGWVRTASFGVRSDEKKKSSRGCFGL